ncbi:MAG: flagellar basal body-associated FliL family protein [Syntrophobacteraceae bacterium]|nr:flagellar basal body-associated FliL family protein [Syntrophobacteraceae bacterium]
MSTEEESKEVAKKSGSKMLLIIVLAVVVLLGAGGAVFYLKVMNTSQAKASVEKEEKPVSLTMPTFLVNLADPGSKRFLKVSMDLMLSSKTTEEECKALDSQLKDLILTVLSSQESSDIVSPEDKLRLKKHLLESLNHVITKGKVLEIYFTDFLIQ